MAGGHAWLGDMHDWEGMHGQRGGCVWLEGCVHRIQPDMVNEWAVRILLECILVSQ